MLPGKRSHAGSGGGVGDVRFEMVGCVYCGALLTAGERLYPFGVGGCDEVILRWLDPDRAENVPGVGTGGDTSDEADGVGLVDVRLEVI